MIVLIDWLLTEVEWDVLENSADQTPDMGTIEIGIHEWTS
jgi:hypothetical protein